MSRESIVNYFDAERSELTQEQVFGEGFLKWLYESRSGSLLGQFLVHSIPCSIYGLLKNRKSSRSEIYDFVEKFKINTSEYPPLESYKNFNEFFAREFLPNKRKLSSSPDVLSAFCEGRYLISDSQNPVHLKGSLIEPLKLLEGMAEAQEFMEATALICRLAPVDYHWFHFPDDGEVIKTKMINGPLHSVSPISLRATPNVLNTNKRVVSILECKNLGRVAFVEIGAFCVGTIKQKYQNKSFSKLDKKGHFLFGGSTVVLLINKEIKFHSELKKYSKEGIETYFKLGSDIGRVE